MAEEFTCDALDYFLDSKNSLQTPPKYKFPDFSQNSDIGGIGVSHFLKSGTFFGLICKGRDSICGQCHLDDAVDSHLLRIGLYAGGVSVFPQ